jgi:hypothetical protein
MPKPQQTGSRNHQQRKKETKRLKRRTKQGRGDNWRRYQVVMAALKQFYPEEPQMMAACLAYIWIVYLGWYTQQTGWNKVIHRTDRCDLSLFQWDWHWGR